MTRTRNCDNPPPAHGGKKCPGDSSEIVSCTGLNPCPGIVLPCCTYYNTVRKHECLHHRLALVKGVYSFKYFLHPIRIPNLLMHVFIIQILFFCSCIYASCLSIPIRHSMCIPGIRIKVSLRPESTCEIIKIASCPYEILFK